jgi:hypothetical protein
MPCDTSTTLPTAPLNVRFSYKNRPKLALSDSKPNAQELRVEVPLTKFNYHDTWYSTNNATDICCKRPSLEREHELHSGNIACGGHKER